MLYSFAIERTLDIIIVIIVIVVVVIIIIIIHVQLVECCLVNRRSGFEFCDTWSFIRFLHAAGVIVFLNKQDVLKEKVESGKSIAKYFPDYAKYQLDSKGKCY